ncbi:4-dihydromethyltrisporate dehydrogenase [Mucor mucedo]|uniref:4-dihydromethyltrisporate dehydrogenase n=1 Tax=Mucor mucedo TaxID=29922 RepID=UPI00221FB226|nr:4-dihydromethyltrisporate dehydrogenase [Mucor mucedo]KAI7889537.1 4-dihydromethyltrisporate dehydrogenase [Mucor mucedo]
MTKFLKLNRTGDKIPLVGFGTARIALEDTADIIYTAIKSGYRLIDAALCYGNEAQVGEGIRKAIDDGIVKREELFVTGKLWNSFHSKDNVKRAFDVTLENFGLDYIDLYLIHFPFATEFVDPRSTNLAFFNDDNKVVFERTPIHETWKAMENLVDLGLVRNIGLSNFNVQSILDLLTYARITPAILEIEFHPYLLQERLITWVKSQGIEVIAYASFGNTVFEEVPPTTAHLPNLLTHPTVTKIAQKHGRNNGQVLLTFATQQNIVVIPKSIQESRMKSNLDLFSYKLDADDIKELKALNANARFNDFLPNTYGFDLPIFE